MAETLGTLVDKLTIANTRLWHLEDIVRDSNEDHTIAQTKRRIDIVNQQRQDLIGEIDSWLYGVLNGKINFRPYDAVKLYNDPSLRPHFKGRTIKGGL